MSKHTQGAWRYVDGYLDCDVWAGNRKILSYERHPTDEDRANARLMAAAPDLLEALQKVLQVNRMNRINAGTGKETVDDLFADDLASAAICKAMGIKND